MTVVYKRVLTVLATVVAFLGVGAAVYASIPGPDGVIHGCRKTTDGSARIIDSAASCPSGFTAINWNQTGPQGPTGATGATGPQGPAGISAVNVIDTGPTVRTVTAGNVDVVNLGCATGQVPISGAFTSDNVHVILRASVPQYGAQPSPPISWIVEVENTDTTDHAWTAAAICATVGS